jgi:hypothetical protein
LEGQRHFDSRIGHVSENYSNKFLVHKPTYPAINLVVQLDSEAGLITYQVEKRVAPEADFSVSETRRMMFFLDDAGEIYLRRGEQIFNSDSAAKFLLLRFA